MSAASIPRPTPRTPVPPRPRLLSLSPDDLVEEPIAPAAPIAPPKVKRAPVRPSIPGTPSRENAIAVAFERVHAMSYLENALDAARYALAVLADAIPCRTSLVHFFDMSRHEFIVVDARGEAADEMRLLRHGVKDPLLRVAMPIGAPFFWNDLSNAPARSVARLASLGQVQRVLVCPVTAGPRWLGAIEIIDPKGGRPFDSPEEGATACVAKHLAEFVSSHGLIVDVATIARFAGA
jgi:hypothetical protein